VADKTTAMGLRPMDRLKMVLSQQSVQEQFSNALGESKGLFIASLIDVQGGSKELQACDPAAIAKEALRAAVLKLPIAKSLGFAWIVPRREHDVWTPQFQIGAKGWIQLAQRTGQYRYLNVGCLFEGHMVHEDLLTGAVTITGSPKNDEVIGFFAYMELLNGFRKAIFWPAAKMFTHRDRYVPKWNRPGSAWVTHPRDMAEKTIISHLLRKWGVLSVEMQAVMQQEIEGELEPQDQGAAPNSEPIDVEIKTDTPEPTDGPGF
jgi:recombination protein RecT